MVNEKACGRFLATRPKRAGGGSLSHPAIVRFVPESAATLLDREPAGRTEPACARSKVDYANCDKRVSQKPPMQVVDRRGIHKCLARINHSCPPNCPATVNWAYEKWRPRRCGHASCTGTAAEKRRIGCACRGRNATNRQKRTAEKSSWAS